MLHTTYILRYKYLWCPWNTHDPSAAMLNTAVPGIIGVYIGAKVWTPESRSLDHVDINIYVGWNKAVFFAHAQNRNMKKWSRYYYVHDTSLKFIHDTGSLCILRTPSCTVVAAALVSSYMVHPGHTVHFCVTPLSYFNFSRAVCGCSKI